MRNTTRSILSTLAATGLTAIVTAALAVPAQAMPERFADAGTIVWCDGADGTLEAFDTTQAPHAWSAAFHVGDVEAFAGAETALLVGDRLLGSAPAYDPAGLPVGELAVAGTIEWGQQEVLSGWDVDPDGRRVRTEGTRTPLTGSVTLSLGEPSATLDCTGWDIDLETFRLGRGPVADRSEGWLQDGHELADGAGWLSFYGDRKTQLGVALDLVEPLGFAGERLQVRNGKIAGTLVLRDPETWEVTGAASVQGTLVRTGSEHLVETGPGSRYVTDLVHYDVTLTITTSTGQWSGTWPATHETIRSRSVTPPRAL